MTHSLRSARATSCALRGQIAVARELRVEDELRDALAVAQIDEDAAAVVAVARDPAEEDDLRPSSFARRAPQWWVRFSSSMNRAMGSRNVADDARGR